MRLFNKAILLPVFLFTFIVYATGAEVKVTDAPSKLSTTITQYIVNKDIKALEPHLTENTKMLLWLNGVETSGKKDTSQQYVEFFKAIDIIEIRTIMAYTAENEGISSTVSKQEVVYTLTKDSKKKDKQVYTQVNYLAEVYIKNAKGEWENFIDQVNPAAKALLGNVYTEGDAKNYTNIIKPTK